MAMGKNNGEHFGPLSKDNRILPEKISVQDLENILHGLDIGDALDIATGKGEFLGFLFEGRNIGKISAIDLSDKLLPILRKTYPDKEIDFKIMDARQISFPDGSFDTVSLSNSLHHMENADQVMAHMNRIVKKEGLILYNEMFCNDQTEQQMSHVLFHHWSASINRLLDNIFHDETYQRERIIAKIEAQNYSSVRIYEYSFVQEDPKDAKLMEYLLNGIDRQMERLGSSNGDSKFDALLKEGAEIKEHIVKYGFSSASSLFFICRK